MKRKISNDDLYFFNQGKLFDSYNVYGAHLVFDEQWNVLGTEFTLYAPNATAVNVIGSFNNYHGSYHKMNKINESSIWQLFIDSAHEYANYKYEIFTKDNRRLEKSDPYGFYSEFRPSNASVIYHLEGYEWKDSLWRENKQNSKEKPLFVYELHIGSWKVKGHDNFYKFNEIIDDLLNYILNQGYTHIELMPVYEHPFDGSWGYQGTGYYSVTSRFGTPKDFMYFIDRCHQSNIGVIMDWVPGHMCMDAHGLYEFDGTPVYEYPWDDIRVNEVWGTANFDFGKGEVRSFLISNALFYMKYFHIDGFRVDAVSNIIYPLGDSNKGTNYQALEFIKELSNEMHGYDKYSILMAEDSTTFPNVTTPTALGGLGFDYKWNMGWMNDVLEYFSKDPIYRKYHHHNLTFGIEYVFKENFILPLSHDEVVHGKNSLIMKMPGAYEEKFANYRMLMGFLITHPGKKLLFMGSDFAQVNEWNYKQELDWSSLDYPIHDSARQFVKDLLTIYKENSPLYESDYLPTTFKWIDANNEEQSIYSFIRYNKDQSNHVIVVLNATPVKYDNYEIGAPEKGEYIELINSDNYIYSGSNHINHEKIVTNDNDIHGYKQSIRINLPPLGITILRKM